MFKGVYTAIVTPFKDGKLDEDALCQFIEWQINEGVQGLIVAGTTGEAPTLSTEEYTRLIELSIKTNRGRVAVIAGTGTNSTQKTIDTTRLAKDLGADGALVVMPYYNKPTQEGMRRHFEAVADAVDLPILIYNVPSRCIVDMSVDTMAALATHKNIVGVKDATDDLSRPVLTRRACGPDFCLMTGENGTFGAFLAQGGDGGILVTSNVTPKALRMMYDAWLAKDMDTFSRINLALAPLHKALFCESNPSPVKYAVSRLNLCKNELRQPLVQASKTACEKIDAALQIAADAGFLKLAS
ncbi:MAG: 4-hydroxy-tetrahydrodipicolinate synthase [Alphaproteobacteria bacterium]|nr:4-hydroxy-tetrahydrodipicolinate synthase [Alphaproteobacteria bacterium]